MFNKNNELKIINNSIRVKLKNIVYKDLYGKKKILSLILLNNLKKRKKKFTVYIAKINKIRIFKSYLTQYVKKIIFFS